MDQWINKRELEYKGQVKRLSYNKILYKTMDFNKIVSMKRLCFCI